MKLVFKPWRDFFAVKDDRALKSFLEQVAKASEDAFHKGIRGSNSGRTYRRRGGTHRASAPGDWPARASGKLERSIDTKVSKNEVTIGTGEFYAKFLREGTRKMDRRKMSDDALKEGIETARHRLKDWVRWQRA